jgi:hypothetical protein
MIVSQGRFGAVMKGGYHMRAILIGLATLIVFYRLSKWAMEPAGDPDLIIRRAKNEPKTLKDLKVEFGERLPNGVYAVFKRGVDYQLQGQRQLARQEYDKLERIPRRSGGTFNLTRVSKTIQHNINLLGQSEITTTPSPSLPKQSSSRGMLHNLRVRLTGKGKE